MMREIHFLGSLKFDPERSGKKAGRLHPLARMGFPVPAGFVIPPDMRVESMTDGELLMAIERIGGFPVAVRSSGVLEDLEGASFAGQYVTFLEVSSISALRNRVRECRDSAKSPQVVAYLKKNGLPESEAKVAVFVQRMVDARAAGVAFSIHPLTGREEHALVECCNGLGEKLVSGHVNPTQYVLSLSNGEVVEHQPGSENVILDERVRGELCRNLLEIQAAFNHPQDVEWAIDRDGTLWILQSRPVTRIQWRQEPYEFTNADFKDGGVSARVCTPMMYSLYRDAMMGSMPKYFRDIKLSPDASEKDPWIVCYYGRPYWNASLTKRGLHRVPGFDERKFDEDLGIQKDYGPQGPVRVPTTLRTILPAIPIAIALESHYKRHLKRTAAFLREFPAREADCRARIARFGETGDEEFFQSLIDTLRLQYETESTYFTTIYNNSNAQTDFKSFLEKLDSSTGGSTSAIRLMAGLTDVSHLEMQKDLLRLHEVAKAHGTESREFDVALAEFIRANDYHGDAELELMTPRWGENPERIRELVRGMLASGSRPTDPELSAERQRAEYEREVASLGERLRARFMFRLRFSGALRKKLERMRVYLTRREAVRDCSTRAYFLVRLHLLEAGRRLAAAGTITAAADVFFLQTEEISRLARGERIEGLSATVRFRKLMYAGYRDLTPPNEFGSGVSQRNEASYVEDGSRLKGLGCSQGVIEAPVRVIRTLEEADQLRPGEILVTRFTDPGWTPVLGIVAGIVTEVGGLLSHAAVIGREYGIPAILNLPGATKRLRTGQRVRMDGSAGTVEVLDEAIGEASPAAPMGLRVQAAPAEQTEEAHA